MRSTVAHKNRRFYFVDKLPYQNWLFNSINQGATSEAQSNELIDHQKEFQSEEALQSQSSTIREEIAQKSFDLSKYPIYANMVHNNISENISHEAPQNDLQYIQLMPRSSDEIQGTFNNSCNLSFITQTQNNIPNKDKSEASSDSLEFQNKDAFISQNIQQNQKNQQNDLSQVSNKVASEFTEDTAQESDEEDNIEDNSSNLFRTMELFVEGQPDDTDEVNEYKLSSEYFTPSSKFSVSLKHRREQYRYEMEEKLYSSLRYQIKIQIHDAKKQAIDDTLFGNLKARIAICDTENSEPLPDQEESLDGLWDCDFRVTENETTKILSTNLLLHIKSHLSFHFTRKDYKLVILIYNCNKEIVAAIQSPIFRLFARKPNKKQYSRIKKRKLKEHLEARKRLKTQDETSESTTIYNTNQLDNISNTQIHTGDESRFSMRMIQQIPSVSLHSNSIPAISQITTSLPSIASTMHNAISPSMGSIPSISTTIQSVVNPNLTASLGRGFPSGVQGSPHDFGPVRPLTSPTHLSSISQMPQVSQPNLTQYTDRNIQHMGSNTLRMYTKSSQSPLHSKPTDPFISMDTLGNLYPNAQNFNAFNYNYQQDIRQIGNQRMNSPIVNSLNSSSLSPETSLQNHRLHVYPTNEQGNIELDQKSNLDPMLSIYQNQFAYNYLLQQQLLNQTNQQILCSPTQYNSNEVPPEYQPYIVYPQSNFI